MCRGAWTGLVAAVVVVDGEEGRDAVCERGRAENVIELPLPAGTSNDELRTCCANRGPVDIGVGTWAMCARPPGMSILRIVVGFVLAVILLNVLGSDRYEEDEWEGDGDGGALGGRGRNEALSSASRRLAGDQVDILASEDPSYP